MNKCAILSLRTLGGVALALAFTLLFPVPSYAATSEQARAVLPTFERIDINLVGDFVLHRGERHGYRITAEKKAIEAITFYVKDGELRVRSARNFKTDQPVKIEITASSLSRVRLGGSETVVSDVPALPTFEIRNDGSGTYRASNVAAARVTVLATGSGDIELAGESDQLMVTASGSGDTILDRLVGNQVRVESSGSSTVRVRALRSLNVTVTGAGTVAYRGNPSISQSMGGTGEVIKLEK